MEIKKKSAVLGKCIEHPKNLEAKKLIKKQKKTSMNNKKFI
jgi:hypothetical protein